MIRMGTAVAAGKGRLVADFDDPRLLGAMRAYLAAVDALAAAVAAGDDRAVIDRAEDRAIAAMSLRRRLHDLGWTGPPRRQERPAPPDPESPPGAAPRGPDESATG
jgi:hypothetical protein